VTAADRTDTHDFCKPSFEIVMQTHPLQLPGFAFGARGVRAQGISADIGVAPAGHMACGTRRGGRTVKRISLTLRTRDLATSMAGFTAVLVTLIVFDERVKRQLAVVWKETPERELLVLRDWIDALGWAVALAARDQSITHAPMLIFTAVAILLAILMVRT
jgi:hypothetical protein